MIDFRNIAQNLAGCPFIHSKLIPVTAGTCEVWTRTRGGWQLCSLMRARRSESLKVCVWGGGRSKLTSKYPCTCQAPPPLLLPCTEVQPRFSLCLSFQRFLQLTFRCRNSWPIWLNIMVNSLGLTLCLSDIETIFENAKILQQPLEDIDFRWVSQPWSQKCSKKS